MSLRGRRHGGNAAQNALIFSTTCGPDDQFSISSPKQIRCCPAGSPLAGKLLVGDRTNTRFLIRNSDLSFYSKYYRGSYVDAIDSDPLNLYTMDGGNTLRKSTLEYSFVSQLTINALRMIDASGDPDHAYVTSNNAADGHGVRKVRKSDMTVVASLLATGSGDGQFENPLGCFYYAGYLYVADFTNKRIVKLNASDANLTFDSVVATFAVVPYDLCFDGTNWYVQFATTINKYDSIFTDGTKTVVAAVGYSLTIIPDQGDGNGQTLAITDSTNSHIARYKCSDLSQVGSDVGSSGDGSASLFDPAATCVGGGTWYTDDGRSYYAASGAAPSQNGFTGIFWASAGPHRVTFRPAGGLAAVTGMDANSDLVRQDIKNIYKCVNLTSLKLQTNTSLLLNLGRLTSKLVTIWAYACGAGISGSIRHMTAATSINLRENGASQAQVDAWIADLYANRESMAPGTVNLNGTNSAPSAAGKAQADELVADYSWSITYTL